MFIPFTKRRVESSAPLHDF